MILMKDKTIVVLVIVVVIVGGAFWLYSQNMLGPIANMVNPVSVNSNNTTPPVAGAIVGSKSSSSFGEYLTDTKGITLYVFADDTSLKSNCNGDCLKKWPPYMYDNRNLASSTDALSKRMNAIKRDDGTLQYAYGTKPVYYYIGDKNPGEINGVSVGDTGSKWSVISTK